MHLFEPAVCGRRAGEQTYRLSSNSRRTPTDLNIELAGGSGQAPSFLKRAGHQRAGEWIVSGWRLLAGVGIAYCWLRTRFDGTFSARHCAA